MNDTIVSVDSELEGSEGEVIEIIATAESIEQAEKLIDTGIDTLYIGNDDFGLRLPTSFSNDEVAKITELAHKREKKVSIAVNGLMHNEHIEKISPFLHFLKEINVDSITIGDPGVVQVLRNKNIPLPFVYDAQTMVTSARQVNFWKKRGAVGAILARELTSIELEQIAEQVEFPLEVLVYGATCIHQSLRPLVKNYFNFTTKDDDISKKRGLFLAEPKNEDTHYSVYEDQNGTHIFATDDINLMPQINNLVEMGLTRWKLDGIFTHGDSFVNIAECFVTAKRYFEESEWTDAKQQELNERIIALHPKERTLSDGFFSKDPEEVK